MAGIQDEIDDMVRILHLTQSRSRMFGLATGPALRFAAQAEDAFLLFLVGRRIRESVTQGRLAAVAADRVELRSISPTRCPWATVNSRNGDFLGRMLRYEFGLLGLDLGQLPATGGMVPLQASMGLLGARVKTI